MAYNRHCEQFALLEVMRAGVREYLTFPFERQVVSESVARLAQIAEKVGPLQIVIVRIGATCWSSPSLCHSMVQLVPSHSLTSM